MQCGVGHYPRPLVCGREAGALQLPGSEPGRPSAHDPCAAALRAPSGSDAAHRPQLVPLRPRTGQARGDWLSVYAQILKSTLLSDFYIIFVLTFQKLCQGAMAARTFRPLLASGAC